MSVRALLAELGAGDGDGSIDFPFSLISGDRGDAVFVRFAQGEVLMGVDDVDESPVPTVALTPLEAVRVAAALLHAARGAAT